jgi:quercetin dioxygenase-like cupin family protein
MSMTSEALARRHIKRSQYVSCDDAFIDVRLPGSHPKENYSIIGAGVTQNPGQVINLREAHGFNIGAAGLGPGITNNLHLHFTAEVFIACEGSFTLRWGERGDEGELLLSEGDVICMPTWMFRGFSNSGTSHGFMMTVLGGNDTGGIVWSPDVLERARETGLWLGRDNQLIDVPTGAPPPPSDSLLPPMPADEVAQLRHWSAPDVLARAVRFEQREFRRATLDSHLPGQHWEVAPVIGWGLTQHREHRPAVTEPLGFSVEWLRVLPGQRSAPFVLDQPSVLVHSSGPLSVRFNEGQSPPVDAVMGPWDTLSMPTGSVRRFVNTGTESAEALLIIAGDGRKLPHWATEEAGSCVMADAAAADLTLDAGGYVARRSLLPPSMQAPGA